MNTRRHLIYSMVLTACVVLRIVDAQAALPSPWQDSDIGSPALAGSATYSNGVFSISGEGNDIWNTSDQFHYVYQAVNGDGVLIARVSSLQNTNGWAKAGVMIRETLDANAKNALIIISPSNGSAFLCRSTTGGSSTNAGGSNSQAAPYWVKLERNGNTFIGSTSPDGSAWSEVGSVIIPMSSSAYAGLCVCSVNTASLCLAQFDNVSASWVTATQGGTLQFASAAYSVDEQGGNALITLARIGGESGAVSVSYATSNGTALSGSDYTSESGTLNWADGDSANKAFTVPVRDDATTYISKTVNLVLSNATGGAILGGLSTATLAVIDNDAPVSAADWTLTTNSITESSRPLLGNGYIGGPVPGEGTGWSTSPANHYIAGLYNGQPGSEYRAIMLAWDYASFHNGDAYFDKGTGTVTNYLQTLNMRDGNLTTQFTWTEGGKQTDIDIVTFPSRSDPHVAVIRYSVTPHWSGPAKFTGPFLGSGTSPVNLLEKNSDAGNNLIWVNTQTNNYTTKIAYAGTASFENFSPACTFNDFNTGNQVAMTESFNAVSGQTYTLNIFVGVYTSLESSDPLTDAKNKALAAKAAGYSSVYNANTAEWNNTWQTDIVITGGADAATIQKQVRSNLFNLLCNVRADVNWSIPPTGLYGEGWNGHIFWDAESWMCPPLLITHPDCARSMLQYRYNTLNGSQYNATANGYQGTKLGWECGYSGRDNATGTWPMEIHVGGDVALAYWKYYLVSRDLAWLQQTGYPVVQQIAKFWASRAVYQNNRYEILNVIPPDENAGVINNSVYTNLIAKTTLDIATKMAVLAGQTPDADWQTIANGLWLPFDSTQQIYQEYQGYAGATIKQGDVVLMMFPVEYPMPDALKASNLDYYAQKVGTLATMSDGIQSIIASDLGRRAEAYNYYLQSFQTESGPFNIFSETVGGTPGFMTGIGASLQTVVYGFTGLRIHEDGILLKPLLPSNWTQLKLTHIKIGTGVYNITINGGDIPVVTLVSGTSNVNIYDKNGNSLIPLATSSRGSPSGPFKNTKIGPYKAGSAVGLRFTNLASGSVVRIFTLKGNLVRTLKESDLGTGEVIWNGTNNRKNNIASGLYLYSVTETDNVGTHTKIGKIIERQ